jgi:nitrogen fixation protein NifU and related proteins
MDLRELYQDIILDHNKQPRNFRVLDGATLEADGYNPLCGDKVHVYVEVADGQVKDVAFQGAGCAISQASASLMTEAVRGKSLEEALRLFEGFHQMVAGDGSVEEDAAAEEDLGKLGAFASVKAYPMRVKCATLAWHTFKAALEGGGEPASTE